MIEVLPILFFLVVLVMLMSGYPVSFTLGGVSFIFGFFVFGLDFFNLLPMRIWGVMSNYVLIAVPLFIFMGVMLEKSGIAEELLETMALLFGRLRGGIAISVLLVGTLLAASTGIVGATVVTMGLLSLPVMLKRKYHKETAVGIIMASGTLGQIIPPSIILVLLGSVMNVSVGDLFVAAFIPGLLLVLLFLVWLIILAFIKPGYMPPMPEEALNAFKGRDRWKRIVWAFVLPSLLILAVLGSIFWGIASPTEAAGVGAFGAALLTLGKKRLNKETIKYVMVKTSTITSMVFLILIGASAFSLVFRGMHGDRYITQLILGSNLEPYIFLAIVMLIIFILGFFIDFIEIIFIVVTIVVPIFVQLKLDLVWVAILIAMNLQTSFLTPPFGFSLFYLKGVAPKEITTGHLYRGVIPYIIIQLIALLLITLFPKIVTWLPSVMSAR